MAEESNFQSRLAEHVMCDVRELIMGCQLQHEIVSNERDFIEFYNAFTPSLNSARPRCCFNSLFFSYVWGFLWVLVLLGAE